MLALPKLFARNKSYFDQQCDDLHSAQLHTTPSDKKIKHDDRERNKRKIGIRDYARFFP